MLARAGIHTVIIVRALIIDAFGRERIDAGRSCHLAPVTAQGVKPHLIGGNEQYVSSFSVILCPIEPSARSVVFTPQSSKRRLRFRPP